jgi:pimeloyl-ACP methyl ester carboxylesterase
VVFHRADDGVSLHVEVAGSEGAPTVVLVHGLAASVELGWRATGVLDRLADAGLRTVAYDARGHGASDKPVDPQHYGDDRLARDLAAVAAAYGGPDPIVAGYSMGSTTVLFALARGLVARGAVIGATPTAVLTWSASDEAQCTTAVAVLEGREEPDAALQWWTTFLDASGNDRGALAALLRRHRPVIEDWSRITTPIVVAAGIADTSAAPLAELVARLPQARPLELPGDHITAAAAPELTDTIAEIARYPGGV